MTGTPNQVEWAKEIKRSIRAEFDRVRSVFEKHALSTCAETRSQIQALIEILEEHQQTVLGNEDAGYFIHEWQEITDQVRLLILRDARYQEIKVRAGEMRRAESN